MGHQFKPGDLALTIKATKQLACGSCVEVLYMRRRGEVVFIRHMEVTLSDDFCAVLKDGEKHLYLPVHLIPLRGNFAPEHQKTKEAEPCA